jgi:hypothetical protein
MGRAALWPAVNVHVLLTLRDGKHCEPSIPPNPQLPLTVLDVSNWLALGVPAKARGPVGVLFAALPVMLKESPVAFVPPTASVKKPNADRLKTYVSKGLAAKSPKEEANATVSGATAAPSGGGEYWIVPVRTSWASVGESRASTLPVNVKLLPHEKLVRATAPAPVC